MGHRRASRFGRVALAVAVAACAPSGDPVPPTPTPEPLAMSGPEPIRQPLRPAKPFMAIRSPASMRTPPSGTRPVATETPHAAPQPVLSRPGAKVRVDSAALERAVTKEFAYQPLSVALAKRTTKTELADRIAAAVVYEAERNRMSPSLLAAVLLIENAPFDTTAISSQGAVGLM